MKKDIVIAGLLGGFAIFVWIFLSKSILPMSGSVSIKSFDNQPEIHQMLKERITETGKYAVPYLPEWEQNQIPDYGNQPVFKITYTGFTHNSASGTSMILPLITIFVVLMIAAWLLSVASEKILAKYSRRFLFVSVLGFAVVLFSNVIRSSFDSQPMEHIVFYVITDMVTWLIAGLIIAWRIKPKNIRE
jgi:hypothetical protein